MQGLSNCCFRDSWVCWPLPAAQLGSRLDARVATATRAGQLKVQLANPCSPVCPAHQSPESTQSCHTELRGETAVAAVAEDREQITSAVLTNSQHTAAYSLSHSTCSQNGCWGSSPCSPSLSACSNCESTPAAAAAAAPGGCSSTPRSGDELAWCERNSRRSSSDRSSRSRSSCGHQSRSPRSSRPGEQ